MPRAPHRPSQRNAILDAALTPLKNGEALSLESAARAAGVSKPGLMYHFPTKEALVAALVDHLMARCQQDLEALLPAGGAETMTARDRIAAYVRWTITTEHDSTDFIMLNDPRLREQMTARWVEQLRPWIEVPTDLPPDERARLNAARMIADGCWFADASGILPVPAADRPALLRTALQILEGLVP
jgi:AcrR family transcriptional regulator